MMLATSVYAATLTLLFLGLSIHVVRGRRQHSVALGDGGHDDMKYRIRAQANFAEYTPIFLILLGLVEHQGSPVAIIHLIGTVFVFGRGSHAFGVLIAEPQHKNFKPRIIGMMATFTTLSVLASVLLFQAIVNS